MKFAVESIDERYVTLSREQVARALNICVDTLDEMHRRNEGPPRFRVSPKRWGYRAEGFRRWQQQRERDTADPTA
jgi:hypothetical protein